MVQLSWALRHPSCFFSLARSETRTARNRRALVVETQKELRSISILQPRPSKKTNFPSIELVGCWRLAGLSEALSSKHWLPICLCLGGGTRLNGLLRYPKYFQTLLGAKLGKNGPRELPRTIATSRPWVSLFVLLTAVATRYLRSSIIAADAVQALLFGAVGSHRTTGGPDCCK